MAEYLIVKPGDDYDLVLTEVTAKNIPRAIDELDPDSGEELKVYRIAAPSKTVIVETETVRRVRIE